MLALEPFSIILAPERLGLFLGNSDLSAAPGVYHTLHFATSKMLLIMTLQFFMYLGNKQTKMLPIMSVEGQRL